MVFLHKEVLKHEEEKTIVYRTYTVAARKLEVVSAVQVEKVTTYMHLAWDKYRTLKVTSRVHSRTPFRTEEVMLLSVYLERRASRFREEKGTHK